MRTATAYNDRSVVRTSHKVAEKLAKNAGVDFEDWIGEAIAEYAEDLGVAPDDLNERERLEAIEDRIDRLARAGAAPRRPEPREPAAPPRARRESLRPNSESPRLRYEDDAPRARPTRVRDEEISPVSATGGAGDRLERAIEDIERRAQRNEERTARALESLTGLVANRGLDGSRLEQTVADIEKRAQRNEERTAAALESLQDLVASRGGERERLVQAVAEVETRAQRNADRTAKALESLSQMVAARDHERERVEAAIERANRRSEESEARAARAFESLSAMVAKPAPVAPQAPARPERADPVGGRADPIGGRGDPVADRLDQLSRRAGAPAAAAGSDEEALQLVSERLARRRQKPASEPAPAAPDLSGALGDLRGDLRLLADKVDQLSGAAVGKTDLEAFRLQTREVERALAGAAEKVAGADRMQAKVATLLERVERLASAQPASAEMAQALKALADAHAKADRENPLRALKAVEKQLDDLGARVEAAARRPPGDARAIDDLGRRIETLRAAVERQPRPQAHEFAAALGALNAKLDVAAASGSQSVAGLSALVAAVERLEDEMRRPASVSLDPRPLEDLARRIEGVQGELAPRVDGLHARIDDLSRKLDRPAASPQMEAVEAALRRMAAKVEEGARANLDMRPFEDIARRIEGAQGQVAPKVDSLHARIEDLSRKLDRPAASPQMEAVETALRRMAAKVEENARVAPDMQPLENLARRIEGAQGQIAPKVDNLQARIEDLSRKLDRPAAAPQMEAVETALRRMAAKVEENARVAPDMQPLEDLARRIEGAQGQMAPKVDNLQARIDDISRKLDRPAASPQMEAVEAALRRMAAKVEEGARTAPDLGPFEDIARRIEGAQGQVAPRMEDLQGALEALTRKLDRTPTTPAEIARIDEALGDILARLDRSPVEPHMEALEAALRRVAAKLEENAARPGFDNQPLEDLARRIDGVQGRLGPQVDDIQTALGELSRKFDRPTRTAAEIQRLEEALHMLAAQVETALSRSAVVDPRPLEALERRIDAVRGAVEDSALKPQVARLEAGLAEIRARLDRPSFAPQIEAVDASLKRLATKFEEAAARPATVSLDARPIEDLARRIEGVRASLENSPSMQPHVERLETALGLVSDKLDRAVPIDAQGLNSALAEMNRRLEDAFRRPPELGRDHIDALSAKVEAVRETVERQAQRFEGAEAALREAVEKIERPEENPELTALLATVKGLAAKLERVGGFDQSRLELLLSDMIDRLDRRDESPATLARFAETMTAMSEKLDRMNPGDVSALAAALARGLDRIDRVEDLADRDARLETLVRDVADRLEGVETRLGAGVSGGENWTHVEFAVRDLTEKVMDLRAASDTRAVEQDVRALHDKLDDLAERRFVASAGAPQAVAAPEALVEHLQDIQERLDRLAAKRTTPPGLDEALSELGEQMDALRATREATAREASTVADLRADHATLDRRLDARFSGLQDVLEKLVDRIGRLERDVPTEARAAFATAASASATLARPTLPDIPDRDMMLRAPAQETPVVTAPLRQREEPATKSLAVNAHIAAARRLANAAAEAEPRAPAKGERRAAGAVAQAFAQRAQTMLAANSRPVLLGAAVALPVLTGLAFYEFHGHGGIKKSELDAPAATSTPLSQAAPEIDDAPTGAIGGEPKVIAAPLAPATQKPPEGLAAAIPASVNAALAAAAAGGDLGAEVEVAQRYLEGRTVPRDPKAAADWLQAAADAGSPFANYRLGALYEKGVGVAKDAARARAYYTKAADAGNARAMHNLAVLYAQDGGQGKPDYAAAMDWFGKAGGYGVRDSQFNLGVLYGRGLGSVQDLAQSWLWFSLAARQGDTDAAHKRDEVALRMDGRAMASAKKLLDDFKVTTPDPAVNDPPAVPAAAAETAPDKKETKKPV